MEAQITSNDLERLRGRNGLAFLDCDIPPLELLDLINSAFADNGILLDNSWLKEVLSFQHDGKTDLLLPFGDAKVHPTKIVMWQVLSYQDCRGVFLSDYIQRGLYRSDMEADCSAHSDEQGQHTDLTETMSGMTMQ